jgi:hypothetical protein
MRGLERWQPEDEEPNADVPWVETTDCYVKEVDPGDGTRIPRTFTTRFKSSSNDSEYFIHDPLRFLINTLGKDHPELELNDGWRVTTLVVNHQNTLSRTHLIASVSADSEEQTAGVTLVKKKAP